MKTLISSIFFLAIGLVYAQAQPDVLGVEKVISNSTNTEPVFIKKEVQFTRTAVENLDTMFIPNNAGNAQMYVTKDGVYIVADKPSKTISHEKPKQIVLDLEQAKQASELINPTPDTNVEVKQGIVPKDNGFNVQSSSTRLEAIKANKANEKDLYDELETRTLIEIREENIIGFIFFDAHSSTIKKEYYPELYKLNYLLEQMPDVELMLIGHCDISGSEYQNKTIARSRAQSVYHFLVGILKMDPERFDVYGEEKNIYDVPEGESIFATNPSQKNRSVTLIIK